MLSSNTAKFIIAAIAFVLFSGINSTKAGVGQSSSSHETNPKEYTSDEKRNAVILVSIDGFRPDYMGRVDTPTLDRLFGNGVLAEGMIPVFPTKTFPNHYSLVTGLYTENTGVISNSMYSERMDRSFSLGNRSAVSDGRWYGGEPIWVTAEKQGVRTATMFWPGSEAEIKGIRPTRWFQYDGSLDYKARVDSAITWLSLTDETRPDFITLYFSTVDTYGHNYGPESDSVNASIKMIDGILGYLVDELDRNGFLETTNLMLTSDHGMYPLSREKVIFLDDIISLGEVTVVDWTPVAMLRVAEENVEIVYSQLKAAESDHAFQVYLKQDVPDRFRFKNHYRVPEIIIIADLGYSITSRDFFERRGLIAGTHGWDNLLPEMHAFFLASGPDFANGLTTPPFEMVHLYELMCEILKLTPAPNDGNLDAVRHLLAE